MRCPQSWSRAYRPPWAIPDGEFAPRLHDTGGHPEDCFAEVGMAHAFAVAVDVVGAFAGVLAGGGVRAQHGQQRIETALFQIFATGVGRRLVFCTCWPTVPNPTAEQRNERQRIAGGTAARSMLNAWRTFRSHQRQTPGAARVDAVRGIGASLDTKRRAPRSRSAGSVGAMTCSGSCRWLVSVPGRSLDDTVDASGRCF